MQLLDWLAASGVVLTYHVAMFVGSLEPEQRTAADAGLFALSVGLCGTAYLRKVLQPQTACAGDQKVCSPHPSPSRACPPPELRLISPDLPQVLRNSYCALLVSVVVALHAHARLQPPDSPASRF